MGSADIIPGVSGGTIALILGIYARLVSAISRFDAQFVRLLVQRQWRTAAAHVDLRFLVALGVGILSGIVCLASLVLYLLTDQRSYTLAVFFGLILASSLIVARMVRPRTSGQIVACLALAIVAALFAFWLVGLNQFGSYDSLGYYFLCGAVAICAMILPGISGAYILWLLGAYETVAGIIHNLAHFDVTTREVLTLAVFASGCAVGLVSFSKLLRWLLDRAHMATMAVLGGFMIGSLRLMWPFQVDLTPEVEKLKLKQFEPFMPGEWNAEVTKCLVLALVAMAAVLLLERWGSIAHSEEETPPKS
jgi:putative membrane protein